MNYKIVEYYETEGFYNPNYPALYCCIRMKSLSFHYNIKQNKTKYNTKNKISHLLRHLGVLL